MLMYAHNWNGYFGDIVTTIIECIRVLINSQSCQLCLSNLLDLQFFNLPWCFLMVFCTQILTSHLARDLLSMQ